MEGGSLVSGACSSSGGCRSKFQLPFQLKTSDSVSVSLRPYNQTFLPGFTNKPILNTNSSSSKKPKPGVRRRIITSIGSQGADSARNGNLTLTVAVKEDETARSLSEGATAIPIDCTLPRIDKSGRFCSPRAARELALLIVYASCLEGSDPVRLFEKRLNAPRELYDKFDKSSLLQYDHMSFGGPPITTTTMEEADLLLSQFDAESATEAEVLSAPLKLVYSKLLLRFTKKLLSAVVDGWDSHVISIDKVVPPSWKIEPAGKILELSILHLAMSEISGLRTRHQIVINEAVDLAKRFCDGAAPRIINGCLRTFVEDLSSDKQKPVCRGRTEFLPPSEDVSMSTREAHVTH